MTTYPLGAVIAYMGPDSALKSLETQGWMNCDGRVLSTQQYSQLWNTIGFTYGGSGSTFNLPDLRGMFLRGIDTSQTPVDPDREHRTAPDKSTQTAGAVVGSRQPDQLKNHQHNWDHFFHDISYSGSDIAVHQPPDSGNLQNHSAQATNNDGGGAETRPMNVYCYYLMYVGPC